MLSAICLSLDQSGKNLSSGNGLITLKPVYVSEPPRQQQQIKKMDNDWRSSPATTSYKKHGIPEIFKHGTVFVYAACQIGCPNC